MSMKRVLVLAIALIILVSSFGMTQSTLCQSRACPLKSIVSFSHIFDINRSVSEPLLSFVRSVEFIAESPPSWDVRTESFTRRGPPVMVLA